MIDAPAHDDYKRLELPPGLQIKDCPCCGSPGELWQYSTSDTAPTNKLVMCSNGKRIGPQGDAFQGCPLYMPDRGFYQATIREGVKYWNEFASALAAMLRANHWKKHKALRAKGEGHE